MKYKLLIVEDEEEIVKLITNRLDKTKYDITIAANGSLAQAAIENEYFDLITLDIMIPFIDGLTLCNQVRSLSKETLIVVVSALDLDESKEKAYALGADDYVAKPFSAKLLALKIEALLQRRLELTKTKHFTKQLIRHDEDLKSFYIQGKHLHLTLSEYTILESLYNNINKVFSNLSSH
ncbi:MAG: response regulator transcription factor [Sulfurimonas sp.]